MGRVVVLCCLLWAASGIPALSGPDATAPTAPDPGLTLHRSLPKDPLLVIALSVEDPAQSFRELSELIVQLMGSSDAGARAAGVLEQLDAAVGFSVGEELLAQLGPEISLSLDLPPVDYAMLSVQSGDPEAFSNLVGQVGLLAEVRDAERLERSLTALLALLPGEPTRDGNVVSSRIPVWVNEGGAADDQALRAHVTLSYVLEEDRIALGFSEAWIHAALEKGPKDSKLAAGPDYARVFSELDPRANRLTYVNLPKIRDLVHRSHILTAVLDSNDQTRDLLRFFSEPEVMGVGLGSTAVALDGGVRTTNFGPDWMAGPVMSGGLLAALVMPALLVGGDESEVPGQRTVADLETIGAACEGFSNHTQTYPPTEGWVPVERIAFYLEPVYMANVPRTDDWNNPILYWSDGSTYRILSTGPDGQMDQDWSAVIEPAPAGTAGDIVFGDGRFLSGVD